MTWSFIRDKRLLCQKEIQWNPWFNVLIIIYCVPKLQKKISSWFKKCWTKPTMTRCAKVKPIDALLSMCECVCVYLQWLCLCAHAKTRIRLESRSNLLRDLCVYLPIHWWLFYGNLHSLFFQLQTAKENNKKFIKRKYHNINKQIF